MIYRISGTDGDGVTHHYSESSLANAGYIASKMSDGGADDVSIVDGKGNQISVDDAFAALIKKKRFVTLYNRIRHLWLSGRTK